MSARRNPDGHITLWRRAVDTSSKRGFSDVQPMHVGRAVPCTFAKCLLVKCPRPRGVEAGGEAFSASSLLFVPFFFSGDFNGTAWRCRSRDNLSIIDLHHRAPHRCGGPGPIRDNWADVCGFLKPPGSQRFCKVSKDGAFSFPRKALGLKPNDQTCHHETRLHWQLPSPHRCGVPDTSRTSRRTSVYFSNHANLNVSGVIK